METIIKQKSVTLKKIAVKHASHKVVFRKFSLSTGGKQLLQMVKGYNTKMVPELRWLNYEERREALELPKHQRKED